MKTITTWIALLLMLFSFTSKGFAQNVETNMDNNFYQEGGAIGKVRPAFAAPHANGRRGAALASRAGFNSGITTAAIIAGLVVGALVTVAALLISNSGTVHSH